MKNIIDYALDYLSQGVAVIPSNPKTKAPLIAWSQFQNRLPTKEEVVSMFKQFPKCMISVVTGKVSGLVVIDADSDEAVKTIEEHIPDSFEAVIDVSPRGGRHYWFQMNGIEYQSKSGIFNKCDIKCKGGVLCAPPSKNDTGGEYRFLNQLEFKRSSLQVMPESLSQFISPLVVRSSSQDHVLINNSIIKNANTVPKALELFKEGKRNNNLFPLAVCLREAKRSFEYILQVLINIVPEMAKSDEGFNELCGIVDSAFKHEIRKERNLSAEIHEWVLSTSGIFLSTDVYNSLQLSTRDEKKNVSIVLKRMCNEKIIERNGDRNGCFRKINDTEEIIDYVNVNTVSVDIKFPFQIENYVRIMPKNVVVVAGEPNSGKTAFLLNMVKMNMESNDIYYFSSEMGAMEMQDRLKNFDHPLDKWKFKAIERSSEFADVIRPNAINIIDFLEISDNFYMVSGMIKSIYDKLDKGIAIIAMQKNKGTDFGLGGMRSLEKPRLYLSMSPGELKITKGKNWVSPEKNPNGLKINYKLYKGCNFIPISGWINS